MQLAVSSSASSKMVENITLKTSNKTNTENKHGTMARGLQAEKTKLYERKQENLF